METKIFGGKKVKIRTLSRKDLKSAKKFKNFINSFVEENAQLMMNEKISLKEEKNWLKSTLQNIKKHKKVYLLAEHSNRIIGAVDVDLLLWRKNHIGSLGIAIIDGYRGIGLGTYFITEIMKLANKKLKPKPKILRLGVFPTNKPAQRLYKKMGFKVVAKIPKQIQYKGKLVDEIIMLKYL